MGATAAIAITGIGTGVSAMGQYSTGNKQKDLAFWNASSIEKTAELNATLIEEGTAANAAILDFNAAAAEAQARDAIARGAEQEGLFRQQIRQLIGSQRAGFAGQGVEINADTPLDVQVDTAYLGELDALTIRLNAAREAWGYKLEAENVKMQSKALRKSGELEARNVREVGRAQAKAERMGGRLASSAGKYGAAGTILTNTASIMMQSYGMKKKT